MNNGTATLLQTSKNKSVKDSGSAAVYLQLKYKQHEKGQWYKGGGGCGRFWNVGAVAFIREFQGSLLVWWDS